MKLQIAAAALVPLLSWGCGVDHGRVGVMQQRVVLANEVCRDTYALGTQVTTSGAVPQDATAETFLRGGEVFLSVDVSSASTEQLVEVKWLDPAGQLLHRDARRAPRGTGYVPFSSGETVRWSPGSHRAVVVIDGRSVSEKTFTVL